MESNNRPNSRYHGTPNYSHPANALIESGQSNEKPEKTAHHQASSNKQQRQSYSSQSFNQTSFQNQSNRYHQASASNQPNKAQTANPRYQNKKSDLSQTGEQRAQTEPKKSLKQLSHNVPEIESKLQPLGSRKLPTQTNQIVNQTQTEKKTETDSKTTNTEYQEPKQNVWNRNQNESNQDPQSKQAQNKQEQKNKYQQRSNQSYRNARRRYEDDYEEDYDEDYDDYTEEDEEQYSQTNSNRTASNSAYPRRPNSSHYPQSYKRGTNRRSNDYYEIESKNYYPSYPNRYYSYNYPKEYSNYNYRGGNSRNSGYTTNNKVFYNSNTKNAGAKEPKEPQNRSRDQTSMTKQSEPTDGEMYDEWETASDSSIRHHIKKIDEPKIPVVKDVQKPKNQPHNKQSNSKKSSNQKDFKSRKTSSNTNPNDPRYTAKYWSDNSKNEKSNENKSQENRTKNSAQTKNANNQGRVNLQVYRVDKIVADDPEAIKEALKNQTIKEKSVTKTNPLSGIDLNNRAGVVIVDYIPESGEIAIEENSAEDEDKDDDDGFQKVKTKRDKKAEKLKAQAEAAAAAAAKLASVNSTKRKEAKSSKKTAPKAEPKVKVNKNGIMNNIQTWKNDMAKPGAKAATQLVKPASVIAEPRTKSLPDDLKKTTTNVWETNANRIEQNSVKEEKCAVVETKPVEKDVKSFESLAKPKEETSKEINLLKQDTQPSQKNVCTVKPTKQVAQPVANEQKPNVNVSVNSSGSGVVSPSSNQQISENQSMNKYYDKIMINQATSSAAVAASAAAAAAAVVAVTVTSIQQQQIPSGEQSEQTVAIKQSSSSSSIKNQSNSNMSAQSDTQHTNNNELGQMTPNQTNYNFVPASTTSQTSLISSPSQTNSQISTTSLIHSLSINQSMPQYLQPIYTPMVQPFMSQSRPMVPQPPQSQSANSIIQNQQNKNNLNSLIDLSFGEFGAKEAMFYPPPPPHPQNYMGQIPPGPMPPPQPMPPHLSAQPINPYPNGYEHNQFFNQKILNNKPNGTFVPPPPPSQFNGINSNIKSQFNQTPNQLINQMHQYSKQDFAYFNNQMAPGQNGFGQAQGSNQPTPTPNNNNLGFFMSQIGNLNPNQFQAQAHATVSTQQSVFNMNQGQLSNNQLFGLGYNQPQQQNSQFNLSNLIQTQQNQQQPPNQTSAHRQTPLSIPSSPFIQNDNQAENGFIKQQNGFDYKSQQQVNNQSSYVRNGANLAPNKQIFSSLDAQNFDKNQPINKGLNQPNNYYRGMEQSVQNHYNQVGLIPPQQQPPLLPNPPIMPNHTQLVNQIQSQNINNKISFNKAGGMPRYPNAYQNQNRPAQSQNTYYNQNYNRRSYPNYQNNGKKINFIDAKVVQKNSDLSQQPKQDGSQSGQTQTRGSTPNTIEEKNECNTNVI